ncbi:hypothetical protein AAHA92_31925 [Salvia divinorum]|uniref:Uncharacterized protein n=1 Tax=Salvia divinorum TaxID=28513 RepID=A0ABD1FL08_SALDI
MSFSGGRTPLHTSPLAILLLLLISLFHIMISTQSAAIRIHPQRLAPQKSQTQMFREYFDSRRPDLNATANGTYADYKRKIPSCPDPLHN